MIQANIHEAKTQLSKLIQRAEAGEEVVIARKGKPAVRLQPLVRPNQSPGVFEAPASEAWEAWQAGDGEMAAMWEEWLNAPEPEPIEHEPLSKQELQRIRKLSLEELLAELSIKT